MTGNNGNNGNNGNAGNRGAAGIVGEFGGGWFIEDRFDIPFVTLPPPIEPETPPLYDENDYDEFQTRIGGQIRKNPKTFAENQWTARWAAWRVLDPFAHTDWYAVADGPMASLWQEIDETLTEKELLELARAARDERPAALGQILSEDVEFITDFMSLLSMTPASHPHTYGLLHIGSQIGSYVALHYKAKEVWKDKDEKLLDPGPRPRPSQLLPALMPPVPLPGHPAWPSGHATQARLMAGCVVLALAAVPMAREGREATSDELLAFLAPEAAPRAGDDLKVTSDDLRVLALRIAKNREIAGLHYPSDSRAGRMLADIVLRQLTEIPTFRKVIDAAAKEWASS